MVALAMLETMPATTLTKPEPTPRQPNSQRKTPRQVRDLPRGIDLPACSTGQGVNQAAPRPASCARKSLARPLLDHLPDGLDRVVEQDDVDVVVVRRTGHGPHGYR
jgi:hypothetical protein